MILNQKIAAREIVSRLKILKCELEYSQVGEIVRG